MSKARDIQRGQSIRIRGRTVTVTDAELDLDGKWSISWASGSSSGMHRLPPRGDVKTVYKPKPRWSW